MPATDVEQHFKFLLSCIKHSAAGRVNFGAVAEELAIVSKAAAAKRYERLLKAHDIAPNPATPKKNGEGSANAPGTPTPKTTPARKRKSTKITEIGSDDDDSSSTLKKEVKTEIKTEVKTESDDTKLKTPVKRAAKKAKNDHDEKASDGSRGRYGRG